MEKKLTIAHLAPYLPYGLKARCKSGDDGVITSLDHDEKSLGIKFDNQTHISFRRELHDVSPILRPLSQLTQEIEYNGEKFVPLLELYKISVDDDVQDYVIVTRTDVQGIYVAGIRCLNYSGQYTVLSFSDINGFATQECGDTDIIRERVVILTRKQHSLFGKLFEWHFDVFGLLEADLAIEKGVDHEN